VLHKLKRTNALADCAALLQFPTGAYDPLYRLKLECVAAAAHTIVQE
jgi:hypothetical protein